MTPEQALESSYSLRSPFADKQRWEFHNNLVHLRFITDHFALGDKLLDAGSGIGILTLALHLLGYKIEGMDKYVFQGHTTYYIEDQQRLRSIWQEQGIHIREKDLLTDAIPETYDGVISVAVVEHQKDPQKFLRSIVQPLRAGGRLYLATPNVTHILNRIRFVFGRPPLGNLKEFFESGEAFTGHWREYSLEELRSFFQWVGLDIVEAKTLQSMKPSFRIKSPRDIYVHFFRLFGGIVPGCGDTNILIGKK
jgi:SAM-dependent methyltransferase